MPACPDDNAMAAYVDGALTADEVTRIDAHLSACATCRRDLSAMAVAHTLPGPGEPGDELVPGDTIGRYVLAAEHARGGMGIVAIAFDPELGRNIAIKVLRRDLAGQLLRDEARAMAKLSHPNVVSVHDVGEDDGRLYLAMELVEGVTLRGWLAHQRRGWREILRTCVQAGRGLAAAHRAGLVHRDFKPDNVLCGPDDRVRVTDFGLSSIPRGSSPARRAKPAGSPPPGDSLRSSSLPGTRGLGAGSGFAGTPAYIAPEIWRGERATARSDQWSFCATLHEALYGAPPFSGETREELRLAIERGTFAAPARRGVPARVRRALARGLAVDPAARHATLDALLDELDTVLRRSRPILLAGGAATIALAGLALYAAQPRDELCAMPPALIDDAWNATRASMIEAAFAGTGRKHAADSARRVREILDRYRDDWLAARGDACEATRVRGGQSEAVLDARTRCLDRRRAELAELARVLADQPAPRVVDRAVQAAHDLLDVTTCSAAGVEAELPLPADPARAAQILALEREVAALDAGMTLAARKDLAIARARGILERARPLEHPPLTARASVLLARLGMYTTDHDATERLLYDALVATAAAHDDRLTAEVWTYLVSFAGGTRGDVAAAAKLIKPAEAALARIGSPAKLRAVLHHAQGIAYTMKGDFAHAREVLEQARGETTDPIDQATIDAVRCHVEQRLANLDQARALCAGAAAAFERELGPHHPEVGFALAGVGLVAFEAHDDRAARAAFERALAIIAGSVGERHVSYAMTLNNLGMIEAREDHLAAARRHYERAAAVFESLHHPELYAALGNLGELEQRVGNYARARAHLERALELATALQGEDGERVSHALYSLGSVAIDAGDPVTAQAHYERALAIARKRFGERHPQTAQALYGVGFALDARGDCKHAVAYQQRAVAAYEAVYGGAHPAVADSLTTLAACRLKLGDRRAVADLERALAIRDRLPTDDHFQAAATRWTAARALWQLGGDRARARRLAREARDLYAKAPDPQARAMLPAIDRWLAGHGARR